MPVGAHNLVSTPLILAVVDHSRFTVTWTVSTSSSREEWMDLSTSTETGMPTWRDSEIWKVNTGLDWTSCTASPLESLVRNSPSKWKLLTELMLLLITSSSLSATQAPSTGWMSLTTPGTLVMDWQDTTITPFPLMIRTMTFGKIIVQYRSVARGGTPTAIPLTWTGSTSVEDMLHMPTESTGVHSRDTTIPLNLLKWNWGLLKHVIVYGLKLPTFEYSIVLSSYSAVTGYIDHYANYVDFNSNTMHLLK